MATTEENPLDAARIALRARGLRATASRIAVLQLLGAAERPLTHQDVVEALRDCAWNRSTLYRNLVDLAETGLAHRTVIGGLARFELRGRENSCSEHPHFICTECGGVSHLEQVSVHVRGLPVPRAITDGAFQVQLRGRCDGCTG